MTSLIIQEKQPVAVKRIHNMATGAANYVIGNGETFIVVDFGSLQAFVSAAVAQLGEDSND